MIKPKGPKAEEDQGRHSRIADPSDAKALTRLEGYAQTLALLWIAQALQKIAASDMIIPATPILAPDELEAWERENPEVVPLSAGTPHLFAFQPHLAGSPSRNDLCGRCGKDEADAIHGYAGD